MNDNKRDEAKRILKNYFAMALQFQLTDENYAELDRFVDLIIYEATQVILQDVREMLGWPFHNI